MTRALLCLATTALIVVVALGARPSPDGPLVPGALPDSHHYAYGAEALLHGSYLVDWDGPLRSPRYPPGMSLLLAPFVAIGGLGAAVWLSWASAVLLAGTVGLMVSRIDLKSAPLAMLLSVLTPTVLAYGRVVMSEVPSAALMMVVLALLLLSTTKRSAAAAGVLAGFLVSVRYGDAPLIVAGAVALALDRVSRPRTAPFLLAAAIPVGLLALWQWVAFGAPWHFTYAADQASFGIGYVTGQPFGTELAHGVSNAAAYARVFVDPSGRLMPPLVGPIGLVGALVLLRAGGRRALLARLTLLVSAATLAMYMPYFWQSDRFFLGCAVLVGMVAAIEVTALPGALLRWISFVRGQLGYATWRMVNSGEKFGEASTLSAAPTP